MREDPHDRLDTYDGMTLALEADVVAAMASLIRERGCIVASRLVNHAWKVAMIEHDRTIHRRDPQGNPIGDDEREQGTLMQYDGPTPCRMHERLSS